MTDQILKTIASSQTQVLKHIKAPKRPLGTLESGQLDWGEKQIKSHTQVTPGMVLVRVVGDAQHLEVVVAISFAYEKRPNSWWYKAINFLEPQRVFEYSLIDAGVMPGAAGWSENYLLDTGFSINDAEYEQVLALAK